MSVTVILDTTAVLAYTKGSIAVGELLSIVADDGDTALVPAACLAEAYRLVASGEEGLLGILSRAPCVAVAPLAPGQVPDVGVVARGSVGIDLGHAATEAVGHEALLATREVLIMTRLLPPDWPVLEV